MADLYIFDWDETLFPSKIFDYDKINQAKKQNIKFQDLFNKNYLTKKFTTTCQEYAKSLASLFNQIIENRHDFLIISNLDFQIIFSYNK